MHRAGGVCAEFTFPDPSMYDLLTVGGVTSGNTGSSIGESTSVPWLQMEYDGPRTLDELHCNIQVRVPPQLTGDLRIACPHLVLGLFSDVQKSRSVHYHFKPFSCSFSNFNLCHCILGQASRRLFRYRDCQPFSAGSHVTHR